MALVFLSLVHGLIDCMSVTVVWRAIGAMGIPPTGAIGTVIVYNAIAFGTQWLWGLLADRYRTDRHIVTVSLLAVIAAPVIPVPTGSVVAVAVANALFHAGAGSLVLRLSEGRATPAGIFIAPGAIGLLIGSMTRTVAVLPWLCLAATAIALVWHRHIRYEDRPVRGTCTPTAPLARGIAALALAAVVWGRSATGMSVRFPWTLSVPVPLLTAAAVFLGKIAGGAVADRYGTGMSAVYPVLFAAFLLPMGYTFPTAGIAALILINMTTAVTLTGLYRLYPKRPGLMFGITTAAILAGDLPLWGVTTLRSPAIQAFVLASSGFLIAVAAALSPHIRTKPSIVVS